MSKKLSTKSCKRAIKSFTAAMDRAKTARSHKNYMAFRKAIRKIDKTCGAGVRP